VTEPDSEINGGAPSLVRAIGRWALTAAVINSVIGSGVFGLPAPLAKLLGAWSPLAVIIAGASIFVIVLCFAEVSSRFDQAGGPYLYTRTAFGAATGFQVGWLHLWTRFLTAAAILNIFVTYLTLLLPAAGSPGGRALAMTAAMAIVTVINVRGVRQTTWTVNLFTIAKLLPLAAVAILGLIHIAANGQVTQPLAEPKWTDAILLLVFAYGGFESSVICASESRDPKRDTPFALIAAMLVITATYALVQFAVVGVLPDAANSTAPVGATLGVLIGPAGAVLGSIAVLISVYGWLVGFGFMTPRIMFSMAERRELPRFLAHVHPRLRTPDASIITNAVIALGFGLASNFAQLATFSAITRLGIFALTCAALVRLRKTDSVPSGFRLRAGPEFAILGIVFCIWLLSTRSLDQAWFMPVLIAVGFVFWFFSKRNLSHTEARNR
jgi:basic amino acid/polyamine antiporter, APA family